MIATERLLVLFPLFAMLSVGTWIDLRTRRIPNWLTLSVLLTGLLQTSLPLPTSTLAGALLGVLAGFALNLPFWLLKIRGGGDLKLFAALGAWFGPYNTLSVFLISTIVASIHAIVVGITSGKLVALFRNTATLAVSVAHPRELGINHVTRADGTFKSVGGYLPYAVSIIIAALIVCGVR